MRRTPIVFAFACALAAAACSSSSSDGADEALHSGLSLTVTAQATPSTAKGGDSIDVTLSIASKQTSSIDVTLSVLAPDGSVGYTAGFPATRVVAGAALTLDEPIAVDPSDPAGTYTVAVDIARTGTTKAVYSNHALATFTVTPATPPPPPPNGTVTLRWTSPAAGATVKGTTDFKTSGTSLVNVEIFNGGAFYQRCVVASDHGSADCSIDTTKLADGAASFTAHAWNTPPGDGSFTSEADAGALAFTVANGASGGGGSAQTVGGGSKSSPAVGPAPAYPVGGASFVLVKNWDFGANGTIKSYADLDTHFQYHDQFNTTDNGGNYGAVAVASSASTALSGQPVESSAHPARQFTADSMKTFLVPLDDSGTAVPSQHNTGCGSFQAKWTLPNGGSRLGADILWETRVRYVTPPYFWFAIWTAGNQWDRGAEFDIIESFGYDNGGGNTNYVGNYWHSNSVPGSGDKYGYANWGNDMATVGFPTFDATQWHTWTMLYKADNSYAFYCDGKLVQSGSNYNWTLGADPSGTPLNMSFLFDANWGHNQVASVNHSLPFSAFDGKYYEWDYSRVYLR